MDETAAGADLILPNHVFLERFEDVPVARGYPKPFIGLAQPVVAPLFNTQHTGDVIIQLAQAMGDNIGAAFAWDSYEACLEETLADNWDIMVEQGYWTDAEYSAPGWGNAFETDSGKFEFGNKDIAALPGYRPVKVEGDETEYNLLLIPYDTMRLAGRNIGSPPFLVKSLEDFILQKNDVLIEVNPATAKELGLSDGKFATLSTPKGIARVKVRHFNGIMEGVVALPRGLGHTANNQFLAGKGVNTGQLMGSVSDPATGLDAAWGIRAKLTKA
jgi:anaerobic selenocysteine-containing dehydrogenase